MDRNIQVPEDLNWITKATKLIETMVREPHKVVGMSEAARGAFLGYQTHFNIQVEPDSMP